MLVHGRNRNPVLTGSSVHNQRVERLWRDTYRCVVSLYYQIFYYLEDLGELNPDSDLDLFCLHLVYTQKINYALKAFKEGWNNHAISTERNMTPAQLFSCGILLQSSTHALDTTGLPTHSNLQTDLSLPSVVIPTTSNPLTSEQLREVHAAIEENVEPEAGSDYCIETFLLVKRHLSLFIADHDSS